MHNKDNAANFARGRDVPTRSTTAPHTTLPIAPANTTTAALTPACAGAMSYVTIKKAWQPGPYGGDYNQLRGPADTNPQYRS